MCKQLRSELDWISEAGFSKSNVLWIRILAKEHIKKMEHLSDKTAAPWDVWKLSCTIDGLFEPEDISSNIVAEMFLSDECRKQLHYVLSLS